MVDPSWVCYLLQLVNSKANLDKSKIWRYGLSKSQVKRLNDSVTSLLLEIANDFKHFSHQDNT